MALRTRCYLNKLRLQVLNVKPRIRLLESPVPTTCDVKHKSNKENKNRSLVFHPLPIKPSSSSLDDTNIGAELTGQLKKGNSVTAQCKLSCPFFFLHSTLNSINTRTRNNNVKQNAIFSSENNHNLHHFAKCCKYLKKTLTFSAGGRGEGRSFHPKTIIALLM